jgi:hypothetical protein
MAIKVTGFFKNPSSTLIYDSPLLTLIPYLGYPGSISMDVNIGNNEGTIPYHNIRKNLIYNDLITDPYEKLLDSLETYVISTLTSDTINQQSIFTRTHNYVSISGETIVDLFDLNNPMEELDL